MSTAFRESQTWLYRNLVTFVSGFGVIADQPWNVGSPSTTNSPLNTYNEFRPYGGISGLLSGKKLYAPIPPSGFATLIANVSGLTYPTGLPFVQFNPSYDGSGRVIGGNTDLYLPSSALTFDADSNLVDQPFRIANSNYKGVILYPNNIATPDGFSILCGADSLFYPGNFGYTLGLASRMTDGAVFYAPNNGDSLGGVVVMNSLGLCYPDQTMLIGPDTVNGNFCLYGPTLDINNNPAPLMDQRYLYAPLRNGSDDLTTQIKIANTGGLIYPGENALVGYNEFGYVTLYGPGGILLGSEANPGYILQGSYEPLAGQGFIFYPGAPNNDAYVLCDNANLYAPGSDIDNGIPRIPIANIDGLILPTGDTKINRTNISFFTPIVFSGQNQQETFIDDAVIITGYRIGAIVSGSGVAPLSGSFYQRNNTNNKTLITNFTLNTGSIYIRTGISPVELSGYHRVGFDLTNTLSGLQNVTLGLFGYLK